MQVVTILPSQGGWFQSVVPLTQPHAYRKHLEDIVCSGASDGK